MGSHFLNYGTSTSCMVGNITLDNITASGAYYLTFSNSADGDTLSSLGFNSGFSVNPSSAIVSASAYKGNLISALENNILSIYDTNAELNINSIKRLNITSGGQSEIFSDSGTTYLSVGNQNITLLITPTTYISIGTDYNYTRANYNRTLINGTGSYTISPTNQYITSITDSAITLKNTAGTNSIVLNADLSITRANALRIHADGSHTQLLSPDGLKVLEVNNTGCNVNTGSESYTLPTTRGNSGDVITLTGSNANWATPAAATITNAGTGTSLLASSSSTKGLLAGSGITITNNATDITISGGSSSNAGFSLFSPLLSTATVGAGSKPYWYIVMVPCNTILTGFKTVLSSGSDPFRVGIYRGKTTNSVLTVLDLLSPIITPAGGGFYSAAFVLQAGRSSTYASGDYITVMYHSQGSTNVFGNNVGIADTDLSYTTIANYGNATPPANLGSVAVSATNVNRLAIEFY